MGVAVLLYAFLEYVTPAILKPRFSPEVFAAVMDYLQYRNFEIFLRCLLSPFWDFIRVLATMPLSPGVPF